jgi:hypothetical protein
VETYKLVSQFKTRWPNLEKGSILEAESQGHHYYILLSELHGLLIYHALSFHSRGYFAETLATIDPTLTPVVDQLICSVRFITNRGLIGAIMLDTAALKALSPEQERELAEQRLRNASKAIAQLDPATWRYTLTRYSAAHRLTHVLPLITTCSPPTQ